MWNWGAKESRTPRQELHVIKKIETVWVTGQFQALAPWELGQEAEFYSISFLARTGHQWYSLSLLFPRIPAATPWSAAGLQGGRSLRTAWPCTAVWPRRLVLCPSPCQPRVTAAFRVAKELASPRSRGQTSGWGGQPRQSAATQSVYVPYSPATQESVNSPHIYSAFLSLQEVKSCYEHKVKKALMGKRFRLPSWITFPDFSC